MTKTLWLCAWLVFGSAGCLQIPAAATSADLDRFVALFDRSFSTPPSDATNRLSERRVRIRSPHLPGVWFYTQLNSGEDQRVYRQRLNRFGLSPDGSAVVQTAYALVDPQAFENLWNKPDLAATVDESDFKAMFSAGCQVVWRPGADDTWSGYVDPQTCVVDSARRGRKIRIESESRLSRSAYQTSERGFDLDMKLLWGSEPGTFVTLYPRAASAE